MEEREQQKTTLQSGSAAINLRGLERKCSAFAVALQSLKRPTSRLGDLFPVTESQGGWSRRLFSVNEGTNHRSLQPGARAKAPINDNDSESVSPFPCWRAGGRTGRGAVIHWDSSVVGQKGVRPDLCRRLRARHRLTARYPVARKHLAQFPCHAVGLA